MHGMDCEALNSPNTWATGLSVFLVLGILVSYLPQHAKIIKNGSSAGLSPYWVLLGALSSIAGIFNIFNLPQSRHDMACCRELNGAACGAAVLGIVQIGVQWICFMMILVLYLVYFPHEATPAPPEDGQDSAMRSKSAPRSLQPVLVGASSLFAMLLLGTITLVLSTRAPMRLETWANILGAIAGILSCIQYLPQIYTTYKIQRLLSLSILTLMIQVPGGFLFAFSLFLRVGPQGWSAWLVYCVTATCQAVLLCMAISFYLRDTKQLDKGRMPDPPYLHTTDYDDPTERDALLPPSGEGWSLYDGSTLRTIHGHDRHPKNPIGLLYSASPPDDSSLVSDGGSSPSASHGARQSDREERPGTNHKRV